MSTVREPIAIIGTGCRFPGNSNTPSKLWDLLREPRDLLEPLTGRFNAEGWYHGNGKYHGHTNVQQAYQLSDGAHRLFDAHFFGINAIEANTIDPQMRLLLETVYEALEASGQPVENLRGSDTAVYAGVSKFIYHIHTYRGVIKNQLEAITISRSSESKSPAGLMMTNSYRSSMERDLDNIGAYHASGTSRAMMSNRLSYFFDWHGPSMTIDTACSSSLIAVHQAVLQLRTGESRVAIAAGSNLLLDPADFVSMSKLEMLSSGSRSRMWDKDANGYARGEGVAAVVLKTLSAAEADGDHIECLIRETATNQDGRTQGITTPSSVAQTQLIRDCYARAGLDPDDPAQRPQYFEAHGTGTPAGDPIEAEAIRAAFFPDNSFVHRKQDPLLVGGIKTIIGHSESAAGLAGLIKVSLALQHSLVPPNLLFDEINPTVQPFYGNLRIPTSAIPWPVTHDGLPRRASVNSFGFGGANAHAILESYTLRRQTTGNKNACFIPFLFSAASEDSLSSNLASMCDHLRANGARVNLRDLAMTLHSRRSRFPFGTTITASTAQELCQKLEDISQKRAYNTGQPVCIRPSVLQSGNRGEKPKILGIFTGQGAQSPRMGAALIEQSHTCEHIIDELEARLAKLPVSDRPCWSLKQELLRESTARINQSALSQPLCTALQILQVNLLRKAGVQFSAVVGHSSGEIAAAYCAGMISAEDAICIAYYRGLYSDLAMGSSGKGGTMLAVGTSYEDAEELCSDEEFRNRISVAAVNSSASVTLSGDEEAIDEIKLIFEDEGKFVRRLKVDKAYHSSHMEPCSGVYLDALHKLEIMPHEPTICWFSSVDGGKLMRADDSAGLQARYWNENMVKPVSFMHAVNGAWKFQGPFDLAIELGPHPALKGPTLQNIRGVFTKEIPYTGVHTRDQNAIESFANALGYIWTHLGSVNLSNYDAFLTGHPTYDLVTGLPPYAWDHKKEYWHESRYTRTILSRSEPPNDLLGHPTPDSTDQDMRWRNVLCPKELPWLKDHALQQQAVFPAAGYVVAAVEAAVSVAKAKDVSISLIEVLDLDIAKALAFSTDDSRIETINSVSDIRQQGDKIEACFKFNATTAFEGSRLTLHARGCIKLTVSPGNEAILPVRGPPELGLSNVNSVEFYKSLSRLDYQYMGPFRALTDLKRKLGFATGYITNEQSRLLIHPAIIDAAFQSLLLAHCAPNSGGIWSLQVPRAIRAIRINPLLCSVNMTTASRIAFDCVQPAGTSTLEGDIDLFADNDGPQHTMVQVEGLRCVSFTQPSAKDDKAMFSTTVWDLAVPDAGRAAYGCEATIEQVELARLLERMAIFFLRRLDVDVPRHHPARFTGPYQHYFSFASHILALAKEGRLPLWSSQWDHDSLDALATGYRPYLNIVEVKLLKTIGDHIIEIATGQLTTQVCIDDDMLSQVYRQGLGFKEYTRVLARVVGQITHRYPRMNILEVGAGIGIATKEIFDEIGQRFSSYTYTDISSNLFETAKQGFAQQGDKILYKVLDISEDIGQQGYNEHSYDLIAACAVLHATPKLQDSLKNARRLLKPGGFLVVLELHPEKLARTGAIFGAFTTWWLGANDGRAMSPCISPTDWDRLLRNTGFSGCDTFTAAPNSLVMPTSVFVSQAMDSRVEFLRDPLSVPMSLFKEENTTTTQELILLGGCSLQASKVVAQLKSILSHQWGHNIRTSRTLANINSLPITSKTTVLSLLEIDQAVFKDLNSSNWEALKFLLQEAGTILWVSSGRRAMNPYANMMVGLLRSARHEIPSLDIQSFDVDTAQSLDARELAETLLRLKATTMWQRRDGPDSLLITVEPELVLEQNTAQVVIPRLIESQEMNDRYNSSRRPVLSSSRVEMRDNLGIIRSDQKDIYLQKVPMPEGGNETVVRVTHSLASAIRVSMFGFLHLVLGLNCGSNSQVVALTSEHTLMVTPFAALSTPVSVPVGSEATFLVLLAYHLLANTFFEGTSEGTVVIIHEADETFAGILAEEAERRNIRAVFTTTSPKSGWFAIHPMSPNRAIRAIIPGNTDALFDLSSDDAIGSVGSRLYAHLPDHRRYHSFDTSFRVLSAWKPRGNEIRDMYSRLKECVPNALARLSNISCPSPTLSLSELTLLDRRMPHTVIGWSLPSSGLAIRQRPADLEVQFSDRKTYWLAGLSGGLGLLLCEWMIRHGAKYIVISSRSPRVEEAWLEKMRAAGAIVTVLSCDITDKLAVADLYKNIQSTLPPVAGVCQGAMVLDDTSIQEMSLESFLKVTRPKVEGSIHLNELFQTQDSDFEFFIFLSSAGSLVGRPGQSNYAAANLFMTALTKQRRLRGLAASVMHIGPILGAGYITQQGRDSLPETMKPIFPLSEHDFVQHFAEAVMAGRPGSQLSSFEVATGLGKFESVQEAGPLLSHFTENRVLEETEKPAASPKIPLISRLAAAQSRSEVTRIIRGAFLPKLSALFQLELSKLRQTELKAVRLDEMGIDSLLAVEIRSWFFKMFQVNIPVFKILGGAVVADLIDIARDTIPRELIPMVDDDELDSQGDKPELNQVEPSSEQEVQAGNKAPECFRVAQREQVDETMLEQASFSLPMEDGVNSDPSLVEHTAADLAEHQEEQINVENREEGYFPTLEEGGHTISSKSSIGIPSDDTVEPDEWLENSPTPLTPQDRDEEGTKLCMAPMPPDEKLLKLSFSQSLFWFSAAFSDNPTNLNLTGTFRLTANINIEELKSAVIALGQQHESLRTRFVVEDGEPMQEIMSSTVLRLEHHNIQCESELANYTDEIHNHAYDLESGKTTRLVLLSMSLNQHFFIIGVHHLAMDGESFFPLMKDMLQHYTRNRRQMTAVQYTTFSEKQRKDFASGGFKDELAFWKTELADIPPPLPMLRSSVITSQPVLQAYGNRIVEVKIRSDARELIRALCRRVRVTPFHFYLAVFRVLLCRYTGSEDFSIGIGDANRTEENMDSIGDFVNILPLLFHTQASLQFDALLQETRSKALAALAHSRVPFQLLLNELSIERSAATTPIFQAFMDYRLVRREKKSWGDFQIELMSLRLSKLAYTVTVDIIDDADGACLLTFIARDDLCSREDVEQLANSYILLASAFARQSNIAVGEANMFQEDMIDEALSLGRGPLYQSRQWGPTIVHRVDDMAKRHPKRTAVIAGDGSAASYDEVVNRNVDTIVTDLRDIGITTGSRVAVLQEPTPDWVSSVLAVMRIGAVYVPLDVGTPWVRLAAIVKDCQPQAVLVDDHAREHVGKLEYDDMAVVSVSNKRPAARTQIYATPDTVSAILYTSGSSGTPKGIVLTHQGMRSWLEPCGFLYGMRSSGEVVLQQSSQGFDMSLMQIFTALCFGGSICILPRQFRGDARKIGETITRFTITHTYGTPSEYLSWLRYSSLEALRQSSWKTALVGGEPLPSSVLKEFAALRKDDLRLYHMYGTTEATFCAAEMELDYVKLASEGKSTSSQPSYPAGVALPNYNIYVLDEQRQPLPAGLQGEIYIGGAGVAREYLNNSSLTRTTFVPDPFATADDREKGWNMMQRTGDIGRWSPVDHGAILIEGRISGDTMVKLRGLRVDLRDVEIAILRAGSGLLNEAVVSVRRSAPESTDFLVAHVVFEQQVLPRNGEYGNHLQKIRERLQLPLYMRPAFIIALDALPMTASGKLDRKAISTFPLQKYSGDVNDTAWTATEEKLKAVWIDVLSNDVANLHEITPETDYFHVGGTSLSLLGLREEIKTQFDVELTLVDLFEASTLSSMAHRIEGRIDVLEVIDWAEETKLRRSMAELDSSMLQQVPYTKSRVVVITGASGYLGKALVNATIEDPTVKEIHCLGVRNVLSRTDLKGLDKVTLYEGDLSQPSIGLPQAVIDNLFSRADLIIHNGADISYMKTYQSMRQSNFLVIKDLVEWSMPRMVPFHYISTAGVGSLAPGSRLPEASVASTPPPTDGSMGYTACKWAGENFLEKLVERHPDWPVCVHRPTLISRDETPQLDGMHNILGYACKLGAVPVSQGVARGVVNVVRLETVTAGVLNCALQQDGQRHHRRGEVHFINHAGNLDLPLSDMRKWALKRRADGEIEFSNVDFYEIPLNEWVYKASKLGMHPTVAALLTTFGRAGEVEFPAVIKGQSMEA